MTEATKGKLAVAAEMKAFVPSHAGLARRFSVGEVCAEALTDQQDAISKQIMATADTTQSVSNYLSNIAYYGQVLLGRLDTGDKNYSDNFTNLYNKVSNWKDDAKNTLSTCQASLQAATQASANASQQFGPMVKVTQDLVTNILMNGM